MKGERALHRPLVKDLPGHLGSWQTPAHQTSFPQEKMEDNKIKKAQNWRPILRSMASEPPGSVCRTLQAEEVSAVRELEIPVAQREWGLSGWDAEAVRQRQLDTLDPAGAVLLLDLHNVSPN